MNALPLIYLTWEPSAEPVATFLRYQVYRREAGTEGWTKLARITDQTVAFYQDATVGSGVAYEYAVTQVIDVGGEEIESAFPTEVGASLEIDSAFIHAVPSPERYAEVFADTQSVVPEQEIQYVQPWAASAPVAHVGRSRPHVVELEIEEWWGTGEELWAALEGLQALQREVGAVLMVRQRRGVRFFAVMEQLERDDEAVGFTARIRLREVSYNEEVA
jgi:hypothetical protein